MGNIGNTYSRATQEAYSSYESRSERAQTAFEKNAAILRQDNSNVGGTYSYAYETENGIVAEETGVSSNGVQAQGGYSYTGDDGKVYSVSNSQQQYYNTKVQPNQSNINSGAVQKTYLPPSAQKNNYQRNGY
ncbi:unnamed protein product [Arctia plantaginis]|uniref:Uncharacterized protein n=1 Tax=Arctia plantaginis TaxID=874455 RepID=A0A8S1B2I9_ARCPL|nr:unnamed protein product [Arctia plantaginis]